MLIFCGSLDSPGEHVLGTLSCTSHQHPHAAVKYSEGQLELTTAAYFAKMISFGDELAAAGKPVGDEEMISFILSGLDYNYNPLDLSILAFLGRTDPVTVSDLYAQMMAYTVYDMRLEMLQENHSQFQSSANSAMRRQAWRL